MKYLGLTVLLMIYGFVACGTSSPPAPPIADAAADAPVDASPDAAGGCCRNDMNIASTPSNATLGLAWIAWRFSPSCSMTAATFDAYTTSTKFSIYAEDTATGLPGAALADTIASQPSAPAGFRRATLPPTQLQAGTSYWLAVENTGGGIDGTVSPIAKDGTMTKYVAGGPGAWVDAGNMGAFMFSVAAACP